MFAVAKPILKGVLDHPREAFSKRWQRGNISLSFYFPKDAGIMNRICGHPALLWKAENVGQYLSKQRLP
jgi:hypothetical protein